MKSLEEAKKAKQLENLKQLEELGIPNYATRDKFDKSHGKGSLDAQHKATYYRSIQHEEFLAGIIGIDNEYLVKMGIGVERENDTETTKAMHALTEERLAEETEIARNSSDAPEIIHVLDTIASIQKNRNEILERALKLKPSGTQKAFPLYSPFGGKQRSGQFFPKSNG